jgi:hypothetical protein
MVQFLRLKPGEQLKPDNFKVTYSQASEALIQGLLASTSAEPRYVIQQTKTIMLS